LRSGLVNGKQFCQCERYNHLMIYILRDKPTSEQVAEMLKEYETMIKIVVDVRRRVLAGGGEMHSEFVPDWETVAF